MASDDVVPASSEDRAIGMGCPISRRDYIAGSLVGAGTMLAGCHRSDTDQPIFSVDPAQALAFDGGPGVGDYARSNGNTWRVVSAAHRIRDGAYVELPADVTDTGELHELMIVGGGAAGIGGAYYYQKLAGGRGTCLMLDNHPVFGGEAKQNEFMVGGTRLIAPQGSNMLYRSPQPSKDYLYDELTELGVPQEPDYQTLTGTDRALEFDRSNYEYLWANDDSDSIGLYLDDPVFGRSRRWIHNPWQGGLTSGDVAEPLRSELLRWRLGLRSPRPAGPERDRWLDSMTYRDFLVNEHGLPTAVADFAEPFVASAVGLGSSAASAYSAVVQLGLPGIDETRTINKLRDMGKLNPRATAFPGGNTGVYRAFLKHVRPDALSGGTDFGSIIAGSINFDRLDAPDADVRIRLSSTAVDVRHVGPGQSRVRVIYERGGRLYAAHARRVLMATGGWIAKHVVGDLPEDHRAAYDGFRYSSMVIANVALTNWRFLERLGLTACLYTGGEFGFQCNIRRPMIVPGYAPPLDPGKPIVLTFYAPFVYPGEDAATQSVRCRTEIFNTPYRVFERRIRNTMTTLFGAGGFDPARDIAGIILNRWGHAYVVPEPGFGFGRDGKPAGADVVRQRHGNIAFAAAELRGEQNFRGGVYEARRAIGQLFDVA